MKRKLLAYMFLAMLLGTGSVVFAQSEIGQQLPAKIEGIQQAVTGKTEQTFGLLKQSDLIDAILLLLAEALLLGGLITVVTQKTSLSFSYKQALAYYTPDKEKTRRYSWDDIL